MVLRAVHLLASVRQEWPEVQLPGSPPSFCVLHVANLETGPMALADDDEDDEPLAKKPRLDDGSLQAEESWAWISAFLG